MANCIRCGRQLPGFSFGKKICQWCVQHEASQRGEVVRDAPQPVMRTPWVRRGESTIGLTQIIFGINAAVFVGMAIGQILYGPLLDRYGRKRPLYVGLLIFILTSVGCMLSWNVTSLVVFRFFQALSGSVAWVGAVAMVRDFFPVKESARVFSMLFLIIGVSPLLAPTVGGFIVTGFGWQAIFIGLAAITIFILIIVYLFLPEGHQPDPTISLKMKPMLLTFMEIAKNPMFGKYAFAGAFSFCTLFIYVAGSPIIFMEMCQVSPKVYGLIFALLSVGFIGGGQVNIQLTKKFSSEKIFHVALIIQVVAGFIFLTGVIGDWLGLYGTIAFFFICLQFLMHSLSVVGITRSGFLIHLCILQIHVINL